MKSSLRLCLLAVPCCSGLNPMSPLTVAYGAGVDSTAMLVGMAIRGERPDLIMFADTGDEKPETYAYLPVINSYLTRVGFPEVTVVKNARPRSGDKSLSDSCLRLGTLPALAYGMHQCSLVWKRDPQHKFIKAWEPARKAWAIGEKVTTCIGYDAGKRDSLRKYKAEGKDSPGFSNRFPLIEWDWDREECKRQIVSAGLPLPVKSACFHCPASKKDEIIWLRQNQPQQFAKAILLEETARAKGLKSIVGLGRKFSWADVGATT
jgi:3'-phosphoadenosine 5'-phosphosulfate sulfotransferase (PAPS reductase)/FAD synthetase